MSVIRKISPPNLPQSPAAYSSLFQEQYSNVLRLFFNQLTNVVNAATPYGSFYDTSAQANTTPGTPNIMHLNVTSSAFKTSVVDGVTQNAKVYVAQSGVYNIQFSAQVAKAGGPVTDVTFWLLQNGKTISDSGGYATMQPNSQLITSWNYILPLQAGDYVQLAWSCPGTNVSLPYVAATATVPASPSLIFTINWISSIPL
jgi:hypothetical protein